MKSALIQSVVTIDARNDGIFETTFFKVRIVASYNSGNDSAGIPVPSDPTSPLFSSICGEGIS
ncbi:MAG: hypothetical protein V4568_20035 [Pseudomonadota bacterium]